MSERIFGMETEYGLAVRGRDGGSSRWTDQFLQIAMESLPHLPAADGGGIYLSNGARFYIDCGHPEMTTPECANPWDLVRYMQAGERMLHNVAERLKKRQRDASEVLVFKTNVDHGAGTTWGCHTSFLHRTVPSLVPPQIIPHLVSRIIYSGAGGVRLEEDVLRFTLSPRVAFLGHEISGNSTSQRGIFHTKDEPLSSEGYHRLHIICGESLCSETALWLNMGATALIVAMIEAGLRPGDAVQLSDALGTMHRFANDPTCTRTAQTATNRKLTAVQIQRHYLEMAEAHMHDSYMPTWADGVCHQWRTLLDRLEHGAPASVATTLDWAIKLSLFLQHADRRGVDWNPSPSRKDVGAKRARSSPHEGAALCALHQELSEIDTRFGHLGEQGIFSALDRAGALTQRVLGVDNIDHAVSHPPEVGRARLRGQCVRRFANQRARYACGWRGVWDRQTNRFLDLADPFATTEMWQELPPTLREFPHPIRTQVRSLLSQVLALYDRGIYEAAATTLTELEGLQLLFNPSEHYEYNRLVAWVHSRRGFLHGTAALTRLEPAETFSIIADYVCAYRYQGLVPAAFIDRWIEKGRAQLAGNPDLEPATAVAFLSHCGYTLMRSGRPFEALEVLQDACHPRRRALAHPQNLSRTLAELADVHRALGNRPLATQLLDEAQALQLSHGFRGDYADFALTYRAKLDSDQDRVRTLLGEAKAIQVAHGHRMGEARTLLLQARLSDDASVAKAAKHRLLDLRDQLPALDQCRMFAKILCHWEAWIAKASDPDGGGDFYWWL